MRFKTFFAFVFVLCILFSTTTSSEAEEVSGKAPLAFLPADTYEFEPTLAGTKVMHDFVIQNRGTAPLEIQNVKSG